jgi:hypothetical protein
MGSRRPRHRNIRPLKGELERIWKPRISGRECASLLDGLLREIGFKRNSKVGIGVPKKFVYSRGALADLEDTAML